MNLGGWSFWGADQLSSNIVKNPGFEGLIDAAIAIPVHTGLGSFDDSPDSLARPDSFWEGARYSIRSGMNAGREGTVVHSSHKNRWGLPAFVVKDGDPLPNPGDAVALVKRNNSDLPTQWWYSKDLGNSFAPELRQTRPGSPGQRSLRVVAGARAAATAASYFDSIGPRAGKLLPLAGKWDLSFWVRLDKGSAALRVVFGRQGSSPLLSRDVPLSNSWKEVRLTFSGEDNGPVGTANLLFQITGNPVGEILLDDVDLRRTDDVGQPFRREVLSVLTQMHPAYLRDWQGQLGDTLANRIAGQFARQSQRHRPGDEGKTDFLYGLGDFLDLAVRLNASPWIIVPTVSNDSECAGLGDYLASRRDLATVPEVLVEFGNENWNSLFRPAGIPDPNAHGEAAGRCFTAIRSHAGRLTLKTVINAQAGYPAGAVQFARQSSVSDIVAVAPYFFYSLSAGLPLADRMSILFRPNTSDMQTIAAAVPPMHKELAVYEVNLHNIEGNASADERRPVVGGIGSGAALARMMLDSLALGVRRQCAYSLVGFESRLTSQPGYIPLWGMVRDLGPTQRFRPTGLAVQMLNETVLGDMVATTGSGQGVSVYGFKSPKSWAAVFVSSSSQSRHINFKVPPNVSVAQLSELRSDSPGATNEDAEHVRIVRRPVSVSKGAASFELQPWSLAILRSAD
jgi:hypothetical protein